MTPNRLARGKRSKFLLPLAQLGAIWSRTATDPRWRGGGIRRSGSGRPESSRYSPQRLRRMNRQHKHQVERAAVAAKLRRMGFDVQEVPRYGKFDLLVDGHIRVALRVAFPGRYAHTVTVNGRRYAYDYKSWNFNFHRHGRWDRRYCDIFVCIAKQRRAEDEVFVIPAEEVSGPTFSLHGASKPYRGRYAKFRNRWSLFSSWSRQREGSSSPVAEVA